MNPVWLLILAIGLVGGNSMVLSPIAAEVAASFPGTDPADVLTASALFGGGTALSALLLASRIGALGLGRALMIAVLVLGVSFALSAVSASLLMLSLAQALAGMAAGVALPATYGLAAVIAPKGRESQTLGKVLIGWTLSFVAGVTFSAVLADLVHWRAVYLALAVLALGLAGGVYSLMGLGRSPDGPRLSLVASLRLPGVMPLLTSQLLFMGAFYGLYAYLGPHLTGVLNLSTTLTGFAALSYGIGFGAAVPLDRLLDHVGPNRAAPWVFLMLIAIYGALAAVSGHALALILLCFAWGAVNHFGLNLLVGQLNAASPAHRASVMALNSAVTYGAMLIGTSGFKPIYENAGLTGCALTSAGFILLVLAVALMRQVRQGLPA